MGTHKVSVREAQEDLRCLLDQVKAGDDAVVLRRGVEVGRLVPPERRPCRSLTWAAFEPRSNCADGL